jgi:hypothetical protein
MNLCSPPITTFNYLPSRAITQEAYEECLEAERYYSTSSTVAENLVRVRLIGWMMQKAPTVMVREALALEIVSKGAKGQRHTHVNDIGGFYVAHFIRICAQHSHSQGEHQT